MIDDEKAEECPVKCFAVVNMTQAEKARLIKAPNVPQPPKSLYQFFVLVDCPGRVRLIATIPFIALLACTNALDCWDGVSRSGYVKIDCDHALSTASKYCYTLVTTITMKGCSAALDKISTKCEKDGTSDDGSLTCCDKDYCNGGGGNTAAVSLPNRSTK
ncbi:hypothetical protein AAVH_08111 [Aphelenchoides avenae]|nr:hypothetical protein AAVH_08111 [Aphelenchus avenae]